jgi:hypothetical protein
MVIFLGIFKVADLFEFEITKFTGKKCLRRIRTDLGQTMLGRPISRPRQQEKKMEPD